MSNKKRNTRKPEKKQKSEINDQFSFKSHHHNIMATQKAYDYYEEHKPSNLQIFDSDLFIALDTNFILDIYSMCHKEREQFIRFIEDNTARIIITHQVEYEYTKHRNEHINNYEKSIKSIKDNAKSSLNSTKDALKTAAMRFKQLQKDARVRNDMEDVVPLITPIITYIEEHDVSDEFRQKIDELYQPLKEKLEGVVDLLSPKFLSERDDSVLKALSKSVILPQLTNKEQEFLRELYAKCLKDFEDNKNTALVDAYRFPGVGDRGKIKQNKDPFGDFVIYHELLSFINQYDSDVVLLTSDVSKSDWVRTDKSQYEQQLIDTYLHTDHMLYIYDINNVLPSILQGVELADDDLLEDDDSTVEEGKNAVEDIVEANGEETRQEAKAGVESANKPSRPKLSYLHEMTEEIFLKELKEAIFWSAKYEEGFVSRHDFIINWVGRKHFLYSSSDSVLENLIKEGKVIAYEENIAGKNIRCIKLAE